MPLPTIGLFCSWSPISQPTPLLLLYFSLKSFRAVLSPPARDGNEMHSTFPYKKIPILNNCDDMSTFGTVRLSMRWNVVGHFVAKREKIGRKSSFNRLLACRQLFGRNIRNHPASTLIRASGSRSSARCLFREADVIDLLIFLHKEEVVSRRRRNRRRAGCRSSQSSLTWILARSRRKERWN
jgi:hypothetical protein